MSLDDINAFDDTTELEDIDSLEDVDSTTLTLLTLSTAFSIDSFCRDID